PPPPPPHQHLPSSSAASDVYKRQALFLDATVKDHDRLKPKPGKNRDFQSPVSYTHLTLPMSLEGGVGGGGGGG
ncbi:hypothetical protein ACRTEU_24695, partial [Vibrio alginolyticus]